MPTVIRILLLKGIYYTSPSDKSIFDFHESKSPFISTRHNIHKLCIYNVYFYGMNDIIVIRSLTPTLIQNYV